MATAAAGAAASYICSHAGPAVGAAASVAKPGLNALDSRRRQPTELDKLGASISRALFFLKKSEEAGVEEPNLEPLRKQLQEAQDCQTAVTEASRSSSSATWASGSFTGHMERIRKELEGHIFQLLSLRPSLADPGPPMPAPLKGDKVRVLQPHSQGERIGSVLKVDPRARSPELTYTICFPDGTLDWFPESAVELLHSDDMLPLPWTEVALEEFFHTLSAQGAPLARFRRELREAIPVFKAQAIYSKETLEQLREHDWDALQDLKIGLKVSLRKELERMASIEEAAVPEEAAAEEEAMPIDREVQTAAPAAIAEPPPPQGAAAASEVAPPDSEVMGRNPFAHEDSRRFALAVCIFVRALGWFVYGWLVVRLVVRRMSGARRYPRPTLR